MLWAMLCVEAGWIDMVRQWWAPKTHVEKPKEEEILCPGYANKDIIAFVSKLRMAVGTNDLKTVADMMVYPLLWKRKSGDQWIKDKKYFLNNYRRIMLTFRDAAMMVNNKKWQFMTGKDGCAIGDGAVWFTPEKGITIIQAEERITYRTDIQVPTPTLEELVKYQKEFDCRLCNYWPNDIVIAFFERLKTAVRNDDKETFAEMLRYPCRWNRKKWNKPPVLLKNKKHFIRLYDKIITPKHKDAILSLQFTKDNFISGYECGIGHGILWVSFSDGILAINSSVT